jgi:hypothetical protein
VADEVHAGSQDPWAEYVRPAKAAARRVPDSLKAPHPTPTPIRALWLFPPPRNWGPTQGYRGRRGPLEPDRMVGEADVLPGRAASARYSSALREN